LIESPLPPTAKVKRNGEDEVDGGKIPFWGEAAYHEAAQMSSHILPFPIFEEVDCLPHRPLVIGYRPSLFKGRLLEAAGPTKKLDRRSLAFLPGKRGATARANRELDQADCFPAGLTDEGAMEG
jgi:hypothetical protein